MRMPLSKPESSWVTSVQFDTAKDSGQEVVLPDGRWDIMVYSLGERTRVFLFYAPLTHVSSVSIIEGQKRLLITLKTGAFINISLPANQNGTYEFPLVGRGKIRVGSEIFEIPGPDTVGAFIQALKRKQLLVCDQEVSNAAIGRRPGVSNRTLERRFRKVTNMSPYYYRQVMRAHATAHAIKQGTSLLRVAHDAGFSDQFHMSRSLKRILGQTPSEIACSGPIS